MSKIQYYQSNTSNKELEKFATILGQNLLLLPQMMNSLERARFSEANNRLQFKQIFG